MGEAGTAAPSGWRAWSDAISRWQPGALWRGLGGTLLAEQERWFLWIPVLFGLGILLYFRLPAEPPLLLALMPVPAAIAVMMVWRRGVLAMIVWGCAIAVGLGFAVAKLRAAWVEAPVIERQLVNVEIAGYVELVEPRPTRGQRLTLRVAQLDRLAPEHRPRRVRVRTMGTLPGLKAGDAIRIKATLARPALPALPGDYDFARAAWFSGLGGVGYAVGPPRIDHAAGPAPWSMRALALTERLRQTIGARILAALPGETGAIATALITGERGGITTATTDAYRDSGLIHVLSISGLHMVVMAGAVFYTVRLMLALVPALALGFPIKKWAAAAAILGALGYLLISGYSFPTVRSWITISIAFAAIILDRPAIALRNVALAALVVLALVPESLFDAGFQMSFAAVVALVSAYEAIRDRFAPAGHEGGVRPGRLIGFMLFFGGIVLTTLVASLAVAPFGVFHFHRSQQFAVLANLIAIPICNMVVMPAALATLVAMPASLEAAPLWVMGKGIEAMTWCAYAVARLPGAVGSVPAIPEVSFGLMVVGGLWLSLWRLRWRLLGLAGMAAGLATAPLMQWPDVLVGQAGPLVAVRGSDGRLSAVGSSRSSYDLQRWLEYEGDERAPQVVAGAAGFVCDGIGCLARAGDRLIATARHPGALADDCRRAHLLVLSFPRPEGCKPPGAVIDLWALLDQGTHAVYFDPGGIRMVAVADVRGDRPWSRKARRVPSSGRLKEPARLQGFAAPMDLSGLARRPASDIEPGEQGEDPDTRDDGEHQ